MNVIKRVVENVPDYKIFMTVDELNESSNRLAKEHGDAVEFFEIGRSQEGDPIYALKIGNGERKVLMYAFPHPNEPVGSLMLDYLSWKLVEDGELKNLFKDFTFYIVKAADVVGARLNEGWFKKPDSFREYVYNFYRPAGNKQVEWTFPIDYKTLKFDDPIPETRALMEIIERERPEFMYSLHNAGYGGVYYYITEDAPILYPIFEKIVRDRDIPLALGEPEVPFVEKFDDAVYRMPTTKEIYDYYEEYSEGDPAEIIKSGDSSFGYAVRFNPSLFELVTEVPYYYDERVEDTSQVDELRRDLVLKFLESQRDDYDRLVSLYERVKPGIVVKTRFQEALDYFIESFERSFEARKKWAQTAEDLNRKATVAEKFDNELALRAYSLLKWGMLYRLVKANLESGGEEVFEKTLNEIEEYIEKELDFLEKSLDFNVIPIKKLVQIQLAAGLYSLLYVKGR